MPSPDNKIGVRIDPLVGMSFEQRLHQGVRSFLIERSRAASVANSGKVSIFNPLTSRALAVVEACHVRQGVAVIGTGAIRIGTTDEADAQTNIAVATDTRLTVLQAGFPAFLNTQSSMICREGDAAIIAGTNATLADGSLVAWSDLNLSNGDPNFSVPIVLAPGWGIKIQGNTNTAVRLFLRWYERIAESPELQP